MAVAAFRALCRPGTPMATVPRSPPGPRRVKVTELRCRLRSLHHVRRSGSAPTVVAPCSPSDGRRLGIVGADDRPQAGTGQEDGEGTAQNVERAVEVEVVRLDAGQHGQIGLNRLEGAVALVRLDDEPLPRVPHGIGADLVDVSSDQERGPHTRLDEDERQHGGGGRLPMRAGHGQAAAGGADGGEHLGAGHHPYAPGASLGELGVLRLHRRRIRHRVGARHVLGPRARPPP